MYIFKLKSMIYEKYVCHTLDADVSLHPRGKRVQGQHWKTQWTRNGNYLIANIRYVYLAEKYLNINQLKTNSRKVWATWVLTTAKNKDYVFIIPVDVKW